MADLDLSVSGNVDTHFAKVFFGSLKLFWRAKKAGWIAPVSGSPGGGRHLFDFADFLKLKQRFKTELPPLLPSELKDKERERTRVRRKRAKKHSVTTSPRPRTYFICGQPVALLGAPSEIQTQTVRLHRHNR